MNTKVLGILEYEQMKKEDRDLMELTVTLFATGRYVSRKEARTAAKKSMKRQKNNEILANQNKTIDNTIERRQT